MQNSTELIEELLLENNIDSHKFLRGKSYKELVCKINFLKAEGIPLEINGKLNEIFWIKNKKLYSIFFITPEELYSDKYYNYSKNNKILVLK